MRSALIEFLAQTRFDVALDFTKKLKELLKWFKEQKMFKFYSSSVLLLYDAADPKPKCLVKVVDFAHTMQSKDDTVDENFRDGLASLISFIDYLCSFHFEVFYNERRKEKKWGKENLTKDDPGEFSNEEGTVSIELTNTENWVVDKSLQETDGEGWQYSVNYKGGKWHAKCHSRDNYRRSRWIKIKKKFD